MIRGTLATFKFKANEKNLYLKINSQNLPDEILTDCMRLKQILFNLIGNAVKFTDTGGITVNARCSGNCLHLMLQIPALAFLMINWNI